MNRLGLIMESHQINTFLIIDLLSNLSLLYQLQTH